MTIDPDKQLPDGPQTFNEQFFDAMVRHQIFLMRLSGKIRNDVIEILNATEGDIRDRIIARLQNVTGGLTEENLAKIEFLFGLVARTRNEAWDKVEALWIEEMERISVNEPKFVTGALQTILPVTIDPVIPEQQRLINLVRSAPFEGRTMKEWADKIREDDLARIHTQIRVGVIQGQSSRQIAREVVGTVRLRGTNGVTQLTRNDAATITRTAVNGISNFSRREYFIANNDIFSEELYVATLDGRTTLQCIDLDGDIFNVGEGPYPPIHMNCRSLRIAIIDGGPLSNRPARPFTQRQLVREFAEENGLGDITVRTRLPRGTKGKFDEFARKRMRELTGTVPGKTSYKEFFERQSVEFQRDVLGPTRFKLFKEGNLSLDKFVDQQHNVISLDELARLDNKAFVDAGLDPENFLI